jgi:hypothetical protein
VYETNKDEGSVIDYARQWQKFIDRIVCINHPVISSLFKQSRFISYDNKEKKVSIECAKDLFFFNDWIETTRTLWEPLCTELFFDSITLDVRFTGKQNFSDKNTLDNHIQQRDISSNPVKTPTPEKAKSYIKTTIHGTSSESYHNKQSYKKKVQSPQYNNEITLNISNAIEWPIGSMILKHFPGIITEMREN